MTDLVLPGLNNVRDKPLFRQHFKQLGAGIGPANPDDACAQLHQVIYHAYFYNEIYRTWRIP
jgi:hypothetical protein